MPDQLHTSLRQSPPVRLCNTKKNDQLRVFLCNFVLLQDLLTNLLQL